MLIMYFLRYYYNYSSICQLYCWFKHRRGCWSGKQPDQQSRAYII